LAWVGFGLGLGLLWLAWVCFELVWLWVGLALGLLGFGLGWL